MNGDAETVKRIREAHWRQGSVVPSETVPHLASLPRRPGDCEVSRGDWWIVLSHDCDILNPDLRKEPWIELIVARPVGRSEMSPALRHGRNPRRIQFAGRVRNWSLELEASVHERRLVPRAEFATFAPDSQRAIDPAVRRILTQWVAKRYIRSGFPDAFNDRLRSVQTEFRNFLRRHDPHLKAVYVALDPPDEIPEGRDYRCAVIIVHRADWDDPDERQTMEAELREVLGQCPGIDLAVVTARGTEEFTMADMDRMRRMDFDFLSYEDDDPVLPPEGVDVD